MVDRPMATLWLGRLTFVALAGFVVFLRLLPSDSTPSEFPAPDLILAAAFAWVIRRPEQVPPLLIVAVFLLCDLLFLRAPGLWTLLVLAATEFLRSREALTRELPILMECLLIAALLFVMTLAEQLVLSIFLVQKPSIGVALLHALVTVAAYPLVLATLRFGLGLRRAAPGEVDAWGRPL